MSTDTLTPEKSFGLPKSSSNYAYGTAIFATCAVLLLLALKGTFLLMGVFVAIFGFVMGSINKTRKPIKFYKDYVEIKLAPLSKQNLIPYKSITQIQEQSSSVIIAYNEKESGKVKKVSIHKRAIIKEEFPDFVELLKTKTS